jgi:hypothetical protein
MIVVVRISDASAMRRSGADIELKKRAQSSRSTGQDLTGKWFPQILACESCGLIKLILRLLRCRKARDWRLELNVGGLRYVGGTADLVRDNVRCQI